MGIGVVVGCTVGSKLGVEVGRAEGARWQSHEPGADVKPTSQR